MSQGWPGEVRKTLLDEDARESLQTIQRSVGVFADRIRLEMASGERLLSPEIMGDDGVVAHACGG